MEIPPSGAIVIPRRKAVTGWVSSSSNVDSVSNVAIANFVSVLGKGHANAAAITAPKLGKENSFAQRI